VAPSLPDDPDSWTDEQWLDWLAEVDAEAPDAPTGHPLRHGGGMGVQLMGAAMLGMHQAIYGDTEPDIVMIVDADGDDSAPEGLEVHLDDDDFDASTVTVRPWVYEETDETDESDETGAEEAKQDG